MRNNIDESGTKGEKERKKIELEGRQAKEQEAKVHFQGKFDIGSSDKVKVPEAKETPCMG